MKKTTFSAPLECPVCGAAVPKGAKSCPQCGADERTGWDEEATRYDGLDLPAGAFDDDNASPSQGRRKPGRIGGVRGFWSIVGLALTALVIYLVWHRKF